MDVEMTGDPTDAMTERADPGHREEMESRARTVAFRELYDAHVDFVWRNLRRLGVAPAEVDDRTQEVFVVAHRRWDGFVDQGHGPRAWLFQIVLRVVSDARRHRRRHPEDADGGVAESKRSEPAPQVEEMARKEAMAQLDRALGTIDIGRRAVLVLHEIEEMTAPEIAKAMDLPLNTVYSRLRVAREELEEALHADAQREESAADQASGPLLMGGASTARPTREVRRIR